MDTLPLRTPAPLTAAGRCDRCGARALVRATLPSGSDLLFCAHHGAELRAPLQLQGAVVQDESAAGASRRVTAA